MPERQEPKEPHECGHYEPAIVAIGFPHQQDEEGIAELVKEFTVLSRFVHPNVLRVYAMERHEGATFLVLEYIPGETLRARLKTRGCLPQDEALRCVGLLSEALSYAHAAHVLHRDVKPENVPLDPNNTPQLLDFGVARDLESVVRRTRLVDDDESRLEVLIRASFPLVCVLSFEEDRVLTSIRNIARRLSEDRKQPRRLYVWSASRGLRNDEDQLANPETLEDPTAAIVHVIENPEDAIYVFLDLHRHYSPVTTRLIRDAARAVRTTRKSVLFLSPSYQVPEELQKEVALSVFQLPDRQQLEQVLAGVVTELHPPQPPLIDEEERSESRLIGNGGSPETPPLPRGAGGW